MSDQAPKTPRSPSARAKKGGSDAATPRRSDKPAVNPYNRAREDHLQETAEDYVELVAELIAEKGEARVTDMAKRLGISNVTVTKTVGRLQKAGYLASEPYRAVFLTNSGKDLASQCRERHRIVLEFLTLLGVPSDIACQDAEGMEHHASAETLERMAAFIAERRDGGVDGTPRK